MSTPPPSPTRILLVDDHSIVRAGLRMLIESQATMKIIGEAGNAADALALVAREQPDVVLLDLALGGDNGLDLLPGILAAATKTRVLVLTGVTDTAIHRQALQLGAMGLVLKEKAADVLLKAIEKVHGGEVWFDRQLMGSVLTTMTRPHRRTERDGDARNIATLTARECEVVSLIGEGLKNKQIAARLSISEVTVRHYLTSVFAKLGVTDRLELIIYAYRHALASL